MSYASTEIHARRRYYAVYLLYVVTLSVSRCCLSLILWPVITSATEFRRRTPIINWLFCKKSSA